MNTKSRFIRPLILVSVSLLILFVVILFAPAAHAPTDERGALTTHVAAATVPAPFTPIPAKLPQVQTTDDTLVFSADRDGYAELYAATRATMREPAKWHQLTQGYAPARAPALSPDGTRLAFQSRKDGNWEIYVLDLSSGKIARVTNDLAYDGAPTWSPDSKQIAFESYRAKDLDIWKMNADGTAPVNLTADSSTYDFAPTWSPDGKTILFTGWETGNKQLFTITSDGKERTNLSNNRFHDEQPAWSPDGKQIAFVSNREGCAEKVDATLEEPPTRGGVDSGNCQRRDIFVADFDGLTLAHVKQLTYLGRDVAPAWSPDGQEIVFAAARPMTQPMYVVASAGGLPTALNDDNVWITSSVWSKLDVSKVGTAPVTNTPLYVDKPIPSDPKEGSKYDFVGMKEVYLAPSWGIFSSTVSESFRALRQRVLKESGVDFLSTLSDMTRLITYRCDTTCDDLSWHKSGRAFDSLLTLPRNGKETVVLVREDSNAEVYWHVYLRAAKQDGSMGEPLRDAPWNISVNARANLAPGMGGLEGDIEYGYFVDLTALMREYGWTRISSHDDADFDWRNNREALEYWHFEKEDGLNWWQAMQEVYPPAQLNKIFDWNTIISDWSKDVSRVYLKDVPPPPDAWKWYALVPK